MSKHLHSECHLKDSFKAPASAVRLSRTAECLNLKVQTLLFVSISFCVLPFKDTRSACFLKCSSAWDKKMGTDEIRQKIKWHGAIWSPPEHWKLGWGFGVKGIFIGSEHELIRAAISEGLLASCYFQSEEIWIHKRMPRIQLWRRPEAEATLKCQRVSHLYSCLALSPSQSSNSNVCSGFSINLIGIIHIYTWGKELTALLSKKLDRRASVSNT